jgi:predicted GNAT superfamily acetyltransferase
LLPRLFFQHFTDTSHLVEGTDGRLAAFLIGFAPASASEPEPGTACVHFVGVDPAPHRTGPGAGLYEHFFQQALERGAHTVTCVTSPGNTTSPAFHTGLGFQVDPSETLAERGPGAAGLRRPGHHRITFVRRLEEPIQQVRT